MVLTVLLQCVGNGFVLHHEHDAGTDAAWGTIHAPHMVSHMGVCTICSCFLLQEEEKDNDQMHVFSLHGQKYGYYQTSTLALLAQGSSFLQHLFL